MIKKYINKQTVLFSLIFTIIFCLVFETGLREFISNWNIFLWLILFIVSFAVIYACLIIIENINDRIIKSINIAADNKSINKYLISSFIIIWGCNFVIFLNMYPGTLSCDTPAQLNQAVLDIGFENLNPLINTLVITLFVQIGMVIKDVNLGVALYTFFQFTFYSLTAVYSLYILARIKYTKIFKWICTLFFIWPINLIYATGMWKDTFFAILMLLTMAYMLNLVTSNKNITTRQIVVFCVLVILTSLARNSGWSVLIVGGISVYLYSRKIEDKEKKYNYIRIAYTEIVGSLLAVFIMLVVYPLCNIPQTHSYMGASIPMQQIARLVYDDVCSDEEMEMIYELGISKEAIDSIKDAYDVSLVDPLRYVYDGDKLNSIEFFYTWFRLGLTHPYEYFKAWSDHTSNFWSIKRSSWLYDNRIFENNYGVERQAIIFKDIDLAAESYNVLSKIWPLTMLNNSAFALYLFILCAYLCVRKNTIGGILCIPYIITYVALCIFSFAGLFRYTYQVVICMPLVWGYINIYNYKKDV